MSYSLLRVKPWTIPFPNSFIHLCFTLHLARPKIMSRKIWMKWAITFPSTTNGYSETTITVATVPKQLPHTWVEQRIFEQSGKKNLLYLTVDNNFNAYYPKTYCIYLCVSALMWWDSTYGRAGDSGTGGTGLKSSCQWIFSRQAAVCHKQ